MDLRTTYMGLELKHPLVASSGPLSGSVANIKRLEDAGAAAVVMFSLFEEQLKHESAALEHLMTLAPKTRRRPRVIFQSWMTTLSVPTAI